MADVKDDNDNLLGGAEDVSPVAAEVSGFESSFPAIDTQNEVQSPPATFFTK